LLYGYDAIPAHWIHQLAKKDAIAELAERLGEAISPSIP
jgi:hypothetical protein